MQGQREIAKNWLGAGPAEGAAHAPPPPRRSLLVENHHDVERRARGARPLGGQCQYFAMSGERTNGRAHYFAALLQIGPDGAAVEPLQGQRVIVRRSRDLVVLAVVFEG